MRAKWAATWLGFNKCVSTFVEHHMEGVHTTTSNFRGMQVAADFNERNCSWSPSGDEVGPELSPQVDVGDGTAILFTSGESLDDIRRVDNDGDMRLLGTGQDVVDSGELSTGNCLLADHHGHDSTQECDLHLVQQHGYCSSTTDSEPWVRRSGSPRAIGTAMGRFDEGLLIFHNGNDLLPRLDTGVEVLRNHSSQPVAGVLIGTDLPQGFLRKEVGSVYAGILPLQKEAFHTRCLSS